jgi:hypothetical protein
MRRFILASLGGLVVILVLGALRDPHAPEERTHAGIGRLHGDAGQAILWRSWDAMDGCLGEQQATGRVGVICARGVLVAVPDGTQAQRVWEGTELPWGIIRVRVLDGRAAGTVGVIERGRFQD